MANIEYLIVGGGGSGGFRASLTAGGGGAGGLLTGTDTAVVQAYPVVVGLGGASQTLTSDGINGGDSSFNALTAIGGGGGGGFRGDGLAGAPAAVAVLDPLQVVPVLRVKVTTAVQAAAAVLMVAPEAVVLVLLVETHQPPPITMAVPAVTVFNPP